MHAGMASGDRRGPHVHVGMWAQVAATTGQAIDVEACFSQLTLDVIGKAVFNYDFNALTTDSPLIQVRAVMMGQGVG